MKKTLLIFFTLMFLIASMATANALTLSIPDTTGYIGKTVTIPVKIENASNVGSIELVILYNDSLLNVKKVEKGSLVKGLITYNTSEAGMIAVNLVDSNGINGDGEIIKITFDILATTEGNTSLVIQNAKAYDVDTYTDLPIDTTTGMLTISTTSGTTQTPGFEIITFISAFTLLAILLVLKRR